jgi:hypothetical protein
LCFYRYAFIGKSIPDKVKPDLPIAQPISFPDPGQSVQEREGITLMIDPTPVENLVGAGGGGALPQNFIDPVSDYRDLGLSVT